WPATTPPFPPPPPVDDPPEARPATTPTTTAISPMAATSESENFTRVLVMRSLVSPCVRLPGRPRSRPERTFSRDRREQGAGPGLSREYVYSRNLLRCPRPGDRE